MGKRLVLVDGHALLHRAYHAFPKSLVNSKGELVNAVYGFTRTLLSILRELKPEYVVVAFDKKGPTFRHKEYAEYKAKRPKMDEELAEQIERTREVVEALGIPVLEKEGFEADDVIGTVCKKVKGKPVEVVVVTGDRDVLQLVDERVKVYMPKRGRQKAAEWWKRETVEEKLGVAPEQIVDFKALAGDASDQIPGVKGIGPKTAVELLKRFGSLEGIFRALEEGKIEDRVAEKLRKGREAAELSRRLAEIVRTVPLKFRLEGCRLSDYDKQRAVKKFEELEFKSLISQLPDDSWEEMVAEVFEGKRKGRKEEEVEQMGLF